LWDYTGPDVHENKPVLRFKKDDEITVLNRKTEHTGWGWGELNGTEAYIPLNYFKLINPSFRLDTNATPKVKQIHDLLKTTIKPE